MSSAAVLILMTFLFLFFGYMGVPVAFSLIAGVIVGAAFTDVTFAAILGVICAVLATRLLSTRDSSQTNHFSPITS